MKERSIKSNKVSNGNARNIEQNLHFILGKGYLTHSANKCILIFHKTDYSYLPTYLNLHTTLPLPYKSPHFMDLSYLNPTFPTSSVA